MTVLHPKVFGIGLSKTGTTSLGECFEILGLTPCAHPQTLHDSLLGEGPLADSLHQYVHEARFVGKCFGFGEFPHRILVEQILAHKNYELAIKLAHHFRSFEDRPWNVRPLIPLLDRAFPGSLFILTWREPERWWRSVENWLLRSHPEDKGKRWRYFTQLNVDRIERDAFLAAYEAYNEDIRAYFAGRDDFLAFNFEAGHGWEQLCSFLDLEAPDVPLPHRNKQIYLSEA